MKCPHFDHRDSKLNTFFVYSTYTFRISGLVRLDASEPKKVGGLSHGLRRHKEIPHAATLMDCATLDDQEQEPPRFEEGEECTIHKILAKKGSLFQVEYIYTLDGETIGSETAWVDGEDLKDTEEGLAAIVQWSQKPKKKSQNEVPSTERQQDLSDAQMARHIHSEIHPVFRGLHCFPHPSPFKLPNVKVLLDAVDLDIPLFQYFNHILHSPLYSTEDQIPQLIQELTPPELITRPGRTLKSWVIAMKHYPESIRRRFYILTGTLLSSDPKKILILFTFYQHLLYLAPRVPYDIQIPLLIQDEYVLRKIGLKRLFLDRYYLRFLNIKLYFKISNNVYSVGWYPKGFKEIFKIIGPKDTSPPPSPSRSQQPSWVMTKPPKSNPSKSLPDFFWPFFRIIFDF